MPEPSSPGNGRVRRRPASSRCATTQRTGAPSKSRTRHGPASATGRPAPAMAATDAPAAAAASVTGPCGCGLARRGPRRSPGCAEGTTDRRHLAHGLGSPTATGGLPPAGGLDGSTPGGSAEIRGRTGAHRRRAAIAVGPAEGRSSLSPSTLVPNPARRSGQAHEVPTFGPKGRGRDCGPPVVRRSQGPRMRPARRLRGTKVKPSCAKYQAPARACSASNSSRNRAAATSGAQGRQGASP